MKKITSSIVVLLAATGIFAYIYTRTPEIRDSISETETEDENEIETAKDTNTTTIDTTTPVVENKKAIYKDGEYKVVGKYKSPAGNEDLQVTITLKNNIVVSSVVTPASKSDESLEYQGKFNSGYSAQVIGKNIDTINVTKVSGSSLTPKGFNDAIAKVKVAAKA